MGNKTKFSIVILILAIVSCTINLSETPDIQPDPSPVVSPTVEPTVTPVVFGVVGTVNVRSCASSSCGVVGYLYSGQSVVAACSGNWCEVENGYVFAPCLGQEGICK